MEETWQQRRRVEGYSLITYGGEMEKQKKSWLLCLIKEQVPQANFCTQSGQES